MPLEINFSVAGIARDSRAEAPCRENCERSRTRPAAKALHATKVHLTVRNDSPKTMIDPHSRAAGRLPEADCWDALVRSLDSFPCDFMGSREQPREVERRESLP